MDLPQTLDPTFPIMQQQLFLRPSLASIYNKAKPDSIIMAQFLWLYRSFTEAEVFS